MKNAELNKYYKELLDKYKKLEKRDHELTKQMADIKMMVYDMRVDIKALSDMLEGDE